jgi:hypothetical protein
MSDDDNHYPPRMIAMLEAVRGEGFLLPGGAIPDKHDLMRGVFRVLKPGGRYWWAKSLRE